MHIAGDGENTTAGDRGHGKQGRNADDRDSQCVIILPERKILTVIGTVPTIVVFKIIQQTGGAARLVIFIKAIHFKKYYRQISLSHIQNCRCSEQSGGRSIRSAGGCA